MFIASLFTIGEKQKQPICPSGGFEFWYGTLLVKNLPANAGDASSVPGLRRSPRVGNDNPLQYSCLESSMDRGDWWATVHGVAESDMTEHAHT